ncbi:TIGR01459 family HAD-type hydrolase [Algihabitans albus]|uniref:TIGR01459 family HAD-type hydrolase n=1 Tax=Algihabitans albus TaxID=2164067 RepID=UPI000E5D46AB|nr:TIGR01459 family HAD-type hydrolase [Algihabitans albus]
MIPESLSGVGEIAERFDAILLDQFGVLHDGRAAFPAAKDAVARLRAAGLRLAVLSNSGKRAEANSARLAVLGFDPDHFDAVVTSGELCREHLTAQLASGQLAAGASVYVIASSNEGSPLEGLPVRRATCADEAALVLIAGRDPQKETPEGELATLQTLARRGVPCICANPDRTIYADGKPAPGPGLLAKAYAESGGPIEIIGKPHAPIFEASLEALGRPLPTRTLMVGDSCEHDVTGASALGLATLLIEGGVQASASFDGALPDFVAPIFAW